ncbi:MAG TPA: hypothetical protein VG755_06420 [Nannocystaceae bacterium]|nr:hypothetical protein [Nannocystaceae bacterium]
MEPTRSAVSTAKVSDSVRNESGLYFSPQPEGPGLAGQRHMDSALFDLEQLDASGRAQGTGEPGHEGTPGSGLIDVRAMVGAASDAPRVPVAPSGGLLLGMSTQPAVEPVIDGGHDRTRRRLLFACVVALLAMVGLLAFEALR